MEEIRNFASGCLLDSRGSHDWEHTCRVRRLCLQIGRVESADLVVLEAAAYLHDVGRPFQDSSKGLICHARKGAEIAEKFLAGSALNGERKENIIHCIRTHRFRGDDAPLTLEAKVLFDADKLDSIGAIGIGRTFQFAGEIGARIHNPDAEPQETKPYSENDTAYREFRVKLCRIKDRMLTSEGKRLAEDRHRFMEEFFTRFLEEYEGIR